MGHIISKSGTTALFVIGLIIISPTVTAAASFSDVDKGDEFYEGIQWMANHGINGYKDGTFGTWDDVTRGQSAAFFSKARNLDLLNKEDADRYFNDVDADTDHAEYIATVGKKEIFKGDNNGNFSNTDTLKREQMASAIVKAFDLESQDHPVDIYLGNVSQVHKNNVQILADHGITENLNDYRPRETIKRGQFAQMLMRADKVEKSDNIPPKLNYEGDKAIIVGYGKAFELPEVTATDNEDETIEVTTTITNADGQKFDTINTERPGSYTVTYSAVDDAGNAAKELKITVVVNEPASVDPEMKYETRQYNYNFSKLASKQMKLRTLPKTDANFKWYDASQPLTAYYANPNNFDKGTGAFYQFLKLNNSTDVPTHQLNQKILNDKGKLAGQAKAFKQASDNLDINEIYLVSHALHETGNGTSTLAQGVEVGENNKGKAVKVTSSNRSDLHNIQTVYNFYGVGAYDHAPVKEGAKRAYEKGWFSPDKAIKEGAAFIADGYISRGQDTLYKMRWNPDDIGRHQYATDVGWAVKQTRQIRHIYDQLRETNGVVMTFEIPKFLNQPRATNKPTGADVFHVDKTIDKAGETVVVKTDGIGLNFRKGPTTNFDRIERLSDGDKVTIIGENANWYKVTVDGQEGWVSGDYLDFNDKEEKSEEKKTSNDSLKD